MRKYLIYGLYCPFTDELHYVGKSTCGMVRPLEHLTKSHSEKINEWVAQLKRIGYVPIIKVLEECNEENIDDRELFWIKESKNNGCYLLNVMHNRSGGILTKKEYAAENIFYYKISDIIKQTRLSLDLSSERVSSLAGISRPTLVTIERSLEKTTLHNVKKVLDVLGLEIEIKTKDNSNIFSVMRNTRQRSTKKQYHE